MSLHHVLSVSFVFAPSRPANFFPFELSHCADAFRSINTTSVKLDEFLSPFVEHLTIKISLIWSNCAITCRVLLSNSSHDFLPKN